VFVLDGSLLPAGVISVPTFLRDSGTHLWRTDTRTGSTTLLVSPSASPPASVAGTSPPTLLPLFDADGSSSRSWEPELRRRPWPSSGALGSHLCASSHLEGLGFVLV
jgi:hypothetical protein